MAKKLNEDALKNELAGSSFFLKADHTDSPTPQEDVSPKSDAPKAKEVKKGKEPQSPTSASTKPKPGTQEAEKAESRTILGRPKAFYITAEQDRDLDTLVAEISLRLAGRLNFKVDRSVVVRLILESSNLTSHKTTDRLADELVNRLVSQLTG